VTTAKKRPLGNRRSQSIVRDFAEASNDVHWSIDPRVRKVLKDCLEGLFALKWRRKAARRAMRR
jgi:hypothetical protein